MLPMKLKNTDITIAYNINISVENRIQTNV